MISRWYPLGLSKALSKEVDFLNDDIKMALFGAGHSFDSGNEYFSDISANEITGTGYTAGGALLGSKTMEYKSSDLTSWTNSTIYRVGDLVVPTVVNSHIYKCCIAGTSSSDTEPSWSIVENANIAESGGPTWVEFGCGALVLDASDISWGDATITFSHAVVYVDSGVSATSLLLIDFNIETSVVVSASAFVFIFNDLGLGYIAVS